MYASDELSLPCDDRDFAEWHRGCAWCAVWVVMLEGVAAAPAIAQAVAQGRERLRHVLLPRYARQPHITLAYRGLCEGGDGHAAQEFGRNALERDIALLGQHRLAPFDVQIRGVGSFTSVPYLAVQQGQQPLATLHAALVPEEPAPGWRYVPHVTLGHYGVQWPLSDALQALEGIGQSLPLQPVTQLALVRYASADIAGPLVDEGFWDLATGRYRAAPGALWPDVA